MPMNLTVTIHRVGWMRWKLVTVPADDASALMLATATLAAGPTDRPCLTQTVWTRHGAMIQSLRLARHVRRFVARHTEDR